MRFSDVFFFGRMSEGFRMVRFVEFNLNLLLVKIMGLLLLVMYVIELINRLFVVFLMMIWNVVVVVVVWKCMEICC